MSVLRASPPGAPRVQCLLRATVRMPGLPGAAGGTGEDLSTLQLNSLPGRDDLAHVPASNSRAAHTAHSENATMATPPAEYIVS